MKEDRFTIIPKASIRPNKIVFYSQFISNFKKDVSTTTTIKNEVRQEVRNMGLPVRVQPVANTHNFELSKKAATRIKEKVSWLYELSKSKTVIPSKGKPLYSFKMNFITLTLPGLQAHSTSEITSICLNQFLTECKAKFGLANYVWRLEFQKNGNAHYHIATDTYIDYTSAKLIWNRCLNKLGYVSRYQAKMQGLSFEQYRKEYSNNGETSFEVLRERYGRGCATRWDSPNTVDVRAVGSARNIAFYISKYITKKSDGKLNPVVASREPSETNLRLWFCSKSLSALDKIEIFMDSMSDLTCAVLSGIDKARRFIFDYCSVWYFNAVEQVGETRRNLWLLYREYAYERGYKPAQ
jgi:hypothetical protein